MRAVVGEADVNTPVHWSEEIAARVSDGRLNVIPGAGHLLPLERPDETRKRLRAFATAYAAT